jgi:hypothetical protein
MENKFERSVEFSPAFDGRPARNGGLKEWRTKTMKPDDGTDHTNYGIGGVTIRFLLKGEKGVIQFLISTDWYPPHVQKSRHESIDRHTDYFSIKPDGYDVGYHSPVPMYEGQETVSDSCEYLDGKPCYYDGSSLRADKWVKDILLKEGSGGVWKAMEEEYTHRFEMECEE